MNETALITGCTSGIGLHLARQFARHGHPLVLLAPDAGELAALSHELTAAHRIPVHTIPCNLEAPGTEDEVFRKVSTQGLEVDILVNNAGHGVRGKSWELENGHDLSMVRLETMLRLTRLFLPRMVAKGHGRILNTASVAGFEPGPLLNIHLATKAFVLSYSDALSMELEGSGVTVTALCTEPTDPECFPKAAIPGGKAFVQESLIAPRDVAEAGYMGLMEGEMIVIPRPANKGPADTRRHLPEHAPVKMNEKYYHYAPAVPYSRSRADVERKAGV